MKILFETLKEKALVLVLMLLVLSLSASAQTVGNYVLSTNYIPTFSATVGYTNNVGSAAVPNGASKSQVVYYSVTSMATNGVVGFTFEQSPDKSIWYQTGAGYLTTGQTNVIVVALSATATNSYTGMAIIDTSRGQFTRVGKMWLTGTNSAYTNQITPLTLTYYY